MAAHAFAMEAMTTQCAAFIDRGADDYMLETAMLKVWSTDALWTIVNDTLQIYGGQAYFTDEPYERRMRDARINLIGEGANDVLRVHRRGGRQARGRPAHECQVRAVQSIQGHGQSPQFRPQADRPLVHDPRGAGATCQPASTGRRSCQARVHEFGREVQSLLFRYRESFLERQYQHERLADAACEIYASSCALSRLDALASKTNGNGGDLDREIRAGHYFMKLSDRRIRQCLIALHENDDEATTQVADAYLREKKNKS